MSQRTQRGAVTYRMILPRPCNWCHKLFTPKRRDAIYHSRSCKDLDRQYRRAVEAEIGQAIQALERLRRMMAKRQITVGPIEAAP